MGDWHHYTSELFKLSQTIDLAQACEPGIKFSQSAFEHLAMARVLDRLKLLKNSTARELNCLLPAAAGSPVAA